MPSAVSQHPFSLPEYTLAAWFLRLSLLRELFPICSKCNETFFFFNSESILQVDVLRATALPLLKQFGIDGESLELKVRMYELLPVCTYVCVNHFLTKSLEELYDCVSSVCVCMCVCVRERERNRHLK